MVLGTEMGNQSGVYRPPHCSADDVGSTSHSIHNPSTRDFLRSLSFGIVLLSPGACADALHAISGGADQLEVVVAVAVAPHPKKVTMAAVALTVATVALADSRKLDQPTHLGVVAVAAVELADQHSLASASMTDHHEPASKEEYQRGSAYLGAFSSPAVS